MKVSELQGAALDWAVATCEYLPVRYGFDDNCPEYSTNWAQGGPIIEREGIELNRYAGEWMATLVTGGVSISEEQGSTQLIAAMRSYVASQFGDEIDVPDELCTEEQTS